MCMTIVAGGAAPVVTGVVLTSDKCEKVEITLQSSKKRMRRTRVYVNDREKDFSEPNWSNQEYKGRKSCFKSKEEVVSS